MFCAANGFVMNQNAKTGSLKFHVALLMLSVVFISVFSSSTSPWLAGKISGIDSAIFMVIGKNWAQGLLPYVTAWDHKGPMIFLANAIGYLLTGNHIGVYLVQILCLFLTLLFTFKSFRLFQSGWCSFWLTVLILVALSINYETGNLTEEYILPLMAAFYYKLLRYFYVDHESTKSLLIVAFLGGLILAFSFLSRLTNALGICLGCAVLFLYLIRDKNYQAAFKAVGAFLGGFALLVLPVVIYFYAKGALYDMWYGSTIFNVTNSQVVGGRIMESPFYIAYFFLKFIHSFLLLIAVVLLFKKKSFKDAWTWLALAIGPLLWIAPSTLYAHYGIIIIPLSTVAIILLLNMSKESPKSTMSKSVKYLIGAFGLYALVSFAIELPGQLKAMASEPLHYTDVDTWFDKYDIDKSSFLAYNYDWTIYLNRDIIPPIKFFCGQDAEMRVDELAAMVYDAFVNAQVKWVVVGQPIINKPIREYVESHYTLVATGKDCTLYRLNEDTSD